MCIDDFLIGRATIGQMHGFDIVGGATTQIASQVLMRRTIVVHVDGADTVRLRFTQDSNTTDYLELGGNVTVPLTLTARFHGDLVTRALWAEAMTGDAHVGIYQGVFNPSLYWELKREFEATGFLGGALSQGPGSQERCPRPESFAGKGGTVRH